MLSTSYAKSCSDEVSAVGTANVKSSSTLNIDIVAVAEPSYKIVVTYGTYINAMLPTVLCSKSELVSTKTIYHYFQHVEVFLLVLINYQTKRQQENHHIN